MTTNYVTPEHLAQLSQIRACDMVRAHMIDAMPTNDYQSIQSIEVRKYILRSIADIYDLCKDPATGGLNDAILNASWHLAGHKGYIQRGGGRGAPKDLQRGHWRWAPNGREECIANFPNYDRLVAFARDCTNNVESTDMAPTVIEPELQPVEVPRNIIDAEEAIKNVKVEVTERTTLIKELMLNMGNSTRTILIKGLIDEIEEYLADLVEMHCPSRRGGKPINTHTGAKTPVKSKIKRGNP